MKFRCYQLKGVKWLDEQIDKEGETKNQSSEQFTAVLL
jgi:hypothetical protein